MFMDDWRFQINVGLRPEWDICQEFQCGCCQDYRQETRGPWCKEGTESLNQL